MITKLIPVFAIAAIISFGAAESAFAGIGITPNSFYDISDIGGTGGDCVGTTEFGDGPIPGATWDQGTLTCTLNSDFGFGLESSMQIGEGVTLRNNANMEQVNTSIFDIFGTFENYGTFTAEGPSVDINNIPGDLTTIYNYGTMFIGLEDLEQSGADDVLLNNFEDEINNVGTLVVWGEINNSSIETINNCSTLTVNGVISGGGTINNYIGGVIGGSNPPQFNQVNLACPFVSVGGIGLPVDSVSLLLASASSISLWMIPVIAGIGIGVFVIKRKF